jgi:hypothetical protein
MPAPTMLPARLQRRRRSLWPLTVLQTGAVMFALGLTLLYLNPFWHFDESGLLDARVHWWNTGCLSLIAAGYVIVAVSLIALVALVVSRLAGHRKWPYIVALLFLLGVAAWAAVGGFVKNLNAHFEWNSAEGLNTFVFQTWDDAAGVWRRAEVPNVQREMAELEIQPILRGYFRLNDWQRMNGDIQVKVGTIVPVAWPVALGSGGETLEDPDSTPLMRAAADGDLKAVQQILSAGTEINVNALDQAGQSALIVACQNQKANPDVVKALLNAGANVNLRSRNGYTALTWAQARNRSEIVRLLRRAGGRP